MPEPTPAPAAFTPPSTVEPAKSEGGIDGLMSFTQKIVDAPPTPPVKPTEGEPPKEGQQPPVPPVEPPKGDVVPPKAEPKDDDDSFWEKAPPKFKNAFQKFKRTTGESVSSLTKKIKDLEGKPVQDPKTVETIKALEKEREDLRKELNGREDLIRQSDYQRSAEYKDKYLTPIHKAYNLAVSEIKTLKITNEDGSQRPATQQDFDDIIDLSKRPSEQDEKAEQLFGRSYRRVLNHIDKLVGLRQSADDAVSNANKTFEESQKLSVEQQESRNKEYQSKQTEVRESLPQKYPDFFGEIEGNKEANDALQGGYKIFDDVVSNVNNLSPSQHAEKFELIRSWAAFFPRAYTLRQQDQAKIRSLETELKKYRGTDPSEGGGRPAPSGAPAKAKGIDDMLNAIEK